MKLFGIFGAGGFAREIAPVAKQMLSNRYKSSDFSIVFVDEAENGSRLLNGYPVVDYHEFVGFDAEEKFFNIAIADWKKRLSISSSVISDGILPFDIVAPNSIILDGNSIGDGAVLCPFSTITSNVTIGRFFHSNIYSYVAHDCIIGDFVTFAPNVNCNGNIVIEDYAYVGTGAVIKQGTPEKPLIIGKGAVVGMGAIVTKDVPPNSTVVGNPARLI